MAVGGMLEYQSTARKCEVADPLKDVVMEWVREFAWSMFISNKRKEQPWQKIQ